MSEVQKNLGHATAYGYAKSKGYTGTEEEFAELMADYAAVGQRAEQAATAAAASATAAEGSASDSAASATAAEGFAGNASTAAGNASQAAQNASQSASAASGSATAAGQSATAAAGSATTAGNKASEAAQSATQAAGSATTAGTSATNAQAAQTAAEAAQTAAEDAQAAAETAAASVAGKTEQIDQNTSDISLLKSHLEATQIVNEASGAVASFPDGSDGLPVESLTVTMEPIQDLHGQDAPYPAGGGKNLVDWTGPQTITGQTTLVTYETSEQVAFTASVTGYKGNSINGRLNLYAYNGMALVKQKIGVISSTTAARVSATLDMTGETYDRFLIVITGEASGYSITVSDLQLEKNSTATTYAPYSNICPISGRTAVTVTRAGVNVWDEKWEVGEYDSNGAKTNTPSGIRSTNYISVVPNTTYAFINSANLYVCEYDINKNFIKRYYVTPYAPTKQLSNNCYYVTFNTASTYGTTYNHDISINYPSTDHDYHPGTVASVEVQLGQTVYGGTLDVTTGEMVVDKVIVTFDETKQYAAYGTTIVCSTHLSNPGNFDRMSEIVCNYQKGGLVGCKFSNNGANSIQWTNATNVFNVADADEFKALMGTYKESGNPMTVVYPIATPLTIQLSAQTLTTLKGVNNIWSDGGDVSVDYVADTKLYIEQLTEPDADMVADANIVSGKYFMVGNSLFLATANIASGAAITPGVNCTRTSLAAALNAINA